MNQKPKIKSISYRLLILWKAFIAYRSKQNSLSTVFFFLPDFLSANCQVKPKLTRIFSEGILVHLPSR